MNKKLLLSLGSLTAIAAPVAAVMSCAISDEAPKAKAAVHSKEFIKALNDERKALVTRFISKFPKATALTAVATEKNVFINAANAGDYRQVMYDLMNKKLFKTLVSPDQAGWETAFGPSNAKDADKSTGTISSFGFKLAFGIYNDGTADHLTLTITSDFLKNPFNVFRDKKTIGAKEKDNYQDGTAAKLGPVITYTAKK